MADKSKPRALGVVRLSRETDETTSPERQRESIHGWAQMTGAELVDIAEDIDVSGAVAPWDRESFGAWLKPDRLDSFDTIVAVKIDRVSRSFLDFADLSRYGKRIVAIHDGVDTGTDVGEMVARILSIFADYERKIIAYRIRDGIAHLRKIGRFRGGMVPYGYQAVQLDGKSGWWLIQDPEAVETVHEMKRRILAGESINGIAADLNERSVLSPRDRQDVLRGREPTGRRWDHMSVRIVMTSIRLLGQNEYQGKIVRGDDGLPVEYGEPILKLSELERVRAAVAERGVKRTRTRRTGYLLDIAKCAICRANLYHKSQTIRKKDSEYHYEYYLCQTPDCPSKRLLAKMLEDCIEDEFLDYVGDLEELEAVYIPAEDHTEELKRTQRSLEELRQERRDGLYDYPGGDEEYRRGMTRLVELVKRLSALPHSEARTELRPTGKTYRQQWEAGNRDERRALLLRSGIKLFATRNPHNIQVPYLGTSIPGDLRERMSGELGKEASEPPTGWYPFRAMQYADHGFTFPERFRRPEDDD